MTEHELQKSLINYVRLVHRDVFIFAIPNGGHRHIATARKLKAEGVVSGVADLCLITNGVVSFVEVKTDKGKMSPAQAEFAEICILNDIPHFIVRNIEQIEKAIKEIKERKNDETHVTQH